MSATKGSTFKVEDMSCSHCVGVIDAALTTGLPGIAHTIDLERHEVTVGGDPAAAEAIMRDAGYEPVLIGG